MTKFFAYTVILEEIVDEEEAEAVAQAIRMIRGVAGVAPLEAEPHLYFAAETARRELGRQLLEIVYPKPKGR